VQTQNTARIEETPALRKVEKLDALLREIGDDARGRSQSYAKQTLVPEGGE
jgi:hypothetical protein